MKSDSNLLFAIGNRSVLETLSLCHLQPSAPLGRLLLFVIMSSAGGLDLLARAQQSSAIVPQTSVAIENTNATFLPTFVDTPQANPARPTVTIPAHIPPTGYLQFEQGFLYAGSSPGSLNRQSAFVQTSKISLTTRLLVQFITEPLAVSSIGMVKQIDTVSTDPGDLSLGGQVVAIKSVGALPTVSVGYLRRVRTGSSANLDSGDAVQSLLLFFGGDLPLGLHYDSNVLFNEQTDGATRRAQSGQTLALSHSVLAEAFKERLGGIVELSHFTQPLDGETRQGAFVPRASAVDLLFVGTYSVRPNLVLDLSFDRGLTSTSTKQQASVGFTYILPHRLWRDRHPSVIRVGRP